MVVGEPSSGGQDVEVRHVDINWSDQGMAVGVIFIEVEVLQVDPQGPFRQMLFHVDGLLHRPLDVKVGGRYELDGVVQLQIVGPWFAVNILSLPSMINIMVGQSERLEGGKKVQSWCQSLDVEGSMFHLGCAGLLMVLVVVESH